MEDRKEIMQRCFFSRVGGLIGRTGVVQLGSHPGSACHLWPFSVTVPDPHVSWGGNSPGCSSRCSGSRSYRIEVAERDDEDDA